MLRSDQVLLNQALSDILIPNQKLTFPHFQSSKKTLIRPRFIHLLQYQCPLHFIPVSSPLFECALPHHGSTQISTPGLKNMFCSTACAALHFLMMLPSVPPSGSIALIGRWAHHALLPLSGAGLPAPLLAYSASAASAATGTSTNASTPCWFRSTTTWSSLISTTGTSTHTPFTS